MREEKEEEDTYSKFFESINLSNSRDIDYPILLRIIELGSLRKVELGQNNYTAIQRLSKTFMKEIDKAKEVVIKY